MGGGGDLLAGLAEVPQRAGGGLGLLGQGGEDAGQGGGGRRAGQHRPGGQAFGALLPAGPQPAGPVAAQPGGLGGGVGGRSRPADPGGGHRHPVEVGGVVGQPVGLVHHHDVGLGQHHPRRLGQGAQFQLEQQQVVVGDHHVDVAGLLAGALGEAAAVEGAALLARAVLAGRGDQVPGVVAHAGRGVEAAAGLGPGRPGDQLQRPLLGRGGGQPGRRHQCVHLGQAGVVAAAQRQRRGGVEGVGQARQVTLDQLGLQRLGGGGHDRPPPGGHQGHEVPERLADSGGRVDQQRHPLVEGGGDRLGHAPLDLPLGQPGQGGEGGVDVHVRDASGRPRQRRPAVHRDAASDHDDLVPWQAPRGCGRMPAPQRSAKGARVRDRGRLRRHPPVQGGGDRLPRGARHHRPDGVGRLDRRLVAALGGGPGS
jgi:hypothetical protein